MRTYSRMSSTPAMWGLGAFTLARVLRQVPLITAGVSTVRSWTKISQGLSIHCLATGHSRDGACDLMHTSVPQSGKGKAVTNDFVLNACPASYSPIARQLAVGFTPPCMSAKRWQNGSEFRMYNVSTHYCTILLKRYRRYVGVVACSCPARSRLKASDDLISSLTRTALYPQ